MGTKLSALSAQGRRGQRSATTQMPIPTPSAMAVVVTQARARAVVILIFSQKASER